MFILMLNLIAIFFFKSCSFEYRWVSVIVIVVKLKPYISIHVFMGIKMK